METMARLSDLTDEELYRAWRDELSGDPEEADVLDVEAEADRRGFDLLEAAELYERELVLASVTPLVAAPWNADLHPRGKDGQFINKLGIFKLVDMLDTWLPSGKKVNRNGSRVEVLDIIPNSKTPGDPDIRVGFRDRDGNLVGTQIVKPKNLASAPRAKAHIGGMKSRPDLDSSGMVDADRAIADVNSGVSDEYMTSLRGHLDHGNFHSDGDDMSRVEQAIKDNPDAVAQWQRVGGDVADLDRGAPTPVAPTGPVSRDGSPITRDAGFRITSDDPAIDGRLGWVSSIVDDPNDPGNPDVHLAVVDDNGRPVGRVAFAKPGDLESASLPEAPAAPAAPEAPTTRRLDPNPDVNVSVIGPENVGELSDADLSELGFQVDDVQSRPDEHPNVDLAGLPDLRNAIDAEQERRAGGGGGGAPEFDTSNPGDMMVQFPGAAAPTRVRQTADDDGSFSQVNVEMLDPAGNYAAGNNRLVNPAWIREGEVRHGPPEAPSAPEAQAPGGRADGLPDWAPSSDLTPDSPWQHYGSETDVTLVGDNGDGTVTIRPIAGVQDGSSDETVSTDQFLDEYVPQLLPSGPDEPSALTNQLNNGTVDDDQLRRADLLSTYGQISDGDKESLGLALEQYARDHEEQYLRVSDEIGRVDRDLVARQNAHRDALREAGGGGGGVGVGDVGGEVGPEPMGSPDTQVVGDDTGPSGSAIKLLDGADPEVGSRVTHVKEGREGEIVGPYAQDDRYVRVRFDGDPKTYVRSKRTLKTPDTTATDASGDIGTAPEAPAAEAQPLAGPTASIADVDAYLGTLGPSGIVGGKTNDQLKQLADVPAPSLDQALASDNDARRGVAILAAKLNQAGLGRESSLNGGNIQGLSPYSNASGFGIWRDQNGRPNLSFTISGRSNGNKMTVDDPSDPEYPKANPQLVSGGGTFGTTLRTDTPTAKQFRAKLDEAFADFPWPVDLDQMRMAGIQGGGWDDDVTVTVPITVPNV